MTDEPKTLKGKGRLKAVLAVGAAILGVKGYGIYVDKSVEHRTTPDAGPPPAKVIPMAKEPLAAELHTQLGFTEKTANAFSEKAEELSGKWKFGDQNIVQATESINGKPTTIFARISSGPHWWPHKLGLQPTAGRLDKMCVEEQTPDGGHKIKMVYHPGQSKDVDGLVPDNQVNRYNIKKGEDASGFQSVFFEGSCINYMNVDPNPAKGNIDLTPDAHKAATPAVEKTASRKPTGQGGPV